MSTNKDVFSIVTLTDDYERNEFDTTSFLELVVVVGNSNWEVMNAKRRLSIHMKIQIPERLNEFYGYLFWNKTYTINGKNYETFYCAGNGGSKIFIFKDLPLTIVVTAKAYNRPYGHTQVDKMMEEYILPAIIK